MKRLESCAAAVLGMSFALCLCLCGCAASGGTPKDARTNPEAKTVKTLQACPPTPNCVSTEGSDAGGRMEPLRFTGSAGEAQARLREVIASLPRSEITADEPGYLAADFRSLVFRFVDRAEFAFDEEKKEIRFRCGARIGYWDFGVNRARMEKIAREFTTR